MIGKINFILSVAFLILSFSSQNVWAKEEGCLYKVGVVPQFDERYIFSAWNPLLEELEKKTGCQFTLIGSKNIEVYEQEIRSGKYDFSYVNPVQVWMGYKEQGYIPLVRSSSKKLKGIIVVRKDDPIQDINELDGEKIAFPSPVAIGATLLPQDYLKSRDVNFEPQYVKSHSSVYFHVAKGLERAGGGVGRTLNNQPDYVKNALRILYTTEEVFPHAFVVRKNIPELHVQKVQKAWFSLWEENPGLFSAIPMKDPEVPSIDDYKPLEKWIIE